MASESSVYNVCPCGTFCGSCLLKTTVQDGKILRTERVVYTGPEADDGFVCQKGIASARYPYQPGRLLHPLKRAGERGEGKWQEISWDQALDEIGAKLVAIRDEYGPQSVAMWNMFGAVGVGVHSDLNTRFINTFGAVDLVGTGVDNGPAYAMLLDFGAGIPFMVLDPRVLPSSKYIIVWGANPVENNPRTGRFLAQAQDRGVKVVDIGLVFDGTAGMADEFIAVKPGSDGALALAMAQVIVSAGKHDADFLERHTVAPFLVRDDNGLFLRDDAGNHMMWDGAHGEAVGVAPGTKDFPGVVPALTGAFEVGGVACKPAFQRLADHLEDYTPEAVESITGVSPEVVRRLANEYADAKPAFIAAALGIRYQNQGLIYRALSLLGIITGNTGKMGGGVSMGGQALNLPPAVLNDAAIGTPDGPENVKSTQLRNIEFFEAAKTGKPFPIKAFLKGAGNPVHNYPSRQRWVNDVFPSCDLIVDYDVWMTDTTEYADYVLPDCTSFERTDIYSGYGHVVLMEAGIEPLGEAKPAHWVYRELAKRVGLLDYFDKSLDEWLEIRLDSEDHSVTGIEPPLTLDRLKRDKMVRANVPGEPLDLASIYMEWGFPTASGRIEFYSEQMADIGHALVRNEPCGLLDSQETREKYPFQFFTGRQRFFMQSFYTDDPMMVKLSGGTPAGRMNPADGVVKGIKDGDLVECFNNQGKMQVVMRLDEAIPPGTVQVWFGWRRRQYEGGSTYSELIPDLSAPWSTDALAERWVDYVNASGKQGHYFFGGESDLAGSWDTLWDAVCDVRKVTVGSGGQS